MPVHKAEFCDCMQHAKLLRGDWGRPKLPLPEGWLKF